MPSAPLFYNLLCICVPDVAFSSRLHRLSRRSFFSITLLPAPTFLVNVQPRTARHTWGHMLCCFEIIGFQPENIYSPRCYTYPKQPISNYKPFQSNINQNDATVSAMTVFPSERVNTGTEVETSVQWDTDFVPAVTDPHVNSLPTGWAPERPGLGQPLISPSVLANLVSQLQNIMEGIPPSHDQIRNNLRDCVEALMGLGLCQAAEISRPHLAIPGHIPGHSAVMEIVRPARR